VLALAGLIRLELDRAPRAELVVGALDELVPAAGQGALAIEARAGWAAPDALVDADATACVTAERELTATLEATCNTPVGAHAQTNAGGELELTAWVGRPDGSAWIKDRLRGDRDGLGRAVAERLLTVGARELLE
jgi:hydroxymethylbilane synthase